MLTLQNILYLMVVNLPSDEDMALAKQELERQRQQGTSTSQYVTRLKTSW